MYRLLELVVLAVPVVLFLRAIFPGQSKKLSEKWSKLKREIDFAVWVMLAVMACAAIYSVATLVLAFAR